MQEYDLRHSVHPLSPIIDDSEVYQPTSGQVAVPAGTPWS